jgi:hypothetical protein
MLCVMTWPQTTVVGPASACPAPSAITATITGKNTAERFIASLPELARGANQRMPLCSLNLNYDLQAQLANAVASAE